MLNVLQGVVIKRMKRIAGFERIQNWSWIVPDPHDRSVIYTTPPTTEDTASEPKQHIF